MPAGWGALSVQAQAGDPASTLELCRAALALRTRLHDTGAWTADDPVHIEVDRDDGLLIRRGTAFRLVLAMGERPVRRPPGRLLLASGPVEDAWIPPDTGVWLSTEV